jgi:two-component system, chemotaxis family, chemotaxis protein CheY
MIEFDDELALEYLAESRNQLASVMTDLLSIERDGAKVDEALVDRLYRAMHSVKAGAGFFELVKIHELAHHAEGALSLIRSRKAIPTPGRIRALLSAAERLSELIEDPDASDQADIAGLAAELAGLADCEPSSQKACAMRPGKADPVDHPPRVLLVEDDFACRLLLQTFLSRYGECHIAVNGKEAVDAFRSALDSGQGYNLICMDIMMPEMDGHEAIRRVRAMEDAKGIWSTTGTKIFMTTSVHQLREVASCFNELCDAYLVKPIDLRKLLDQMKFCRLVP